MSEADDIALVRAVYHALGNDDDKGFLDRLSVDIDWFVAGPREMPYAGHWTGRSGVRQYLKAAQATAEVRSFEPLEWLAGNGHVTVLGREHMRARTTGREWEAQWAHVWTIADGKIRRARLYYDTAPIATALLGR